MKQTFAFVAVLALIGFTASAQNSSTQLPPMEQEHILVAKHDTLNRLETLSGIFLNPTKKGTFVLDFEQELKEDAQLEVKNTAGKTVYRKPVSIAKNTTAWRFDLGKLRPDTYLVEVKTSDTTYWTKFKVGK
ncbi:MAG: T9SS type A sorting domain-containing protein [Hymenobacteraceae bacterium]|nr:T9SS type A sorting domain-containing protein [Hymenobacteraceae bacterium]